MDKITIDQYTVEITNKDKVLFPDDGITKAELVDYYARIAETMFPHVKGRLVTMCRYPDGIRTEGFIEKEAPDYFPDWVKRVSVDTRDGEEITMAVCENAATLVYLSSLASITQHIWTSRIDKIDIPDKMVFDLDPNGVGFELVRSVAASLRGLLEDELGLTAFVMSTGSRGLHVVVPLVRSEGFDEIRPFARDVADVLANRRSELVTTQQRIEKRENRVYIDILRNAYGQTSVAPYSIAHFPARRWPCRWTGRSWAMLI